MQSAMAIASRIASGVEAASAHVPGNGAAAHGVSYPFTPKHLAATLALLEASQAFTLNFVWATHSIGTKVYVNAGRAGARYLRPTGTHLCATAMVHTGRARKHTDACCTGGRGARARWRCKKKNRRPRSSFTNKSTTVFESLVMFDAIERAHPPGLCGCDDIAVNALALSHPVSRVAGRGTWSAVKHTGIRTRTGAPVWPSGATGCRIRRESVCHLERAQPRRVHTWPRCERYSRTFPRRALSGAAVC